MPPGHLPWRRVPGAPRRRRRRGVAIKRGLVGIGHARFLRERVMRAIVAPEFRRCAHGGRDTGYSLLQRSASAVCVSPWARRHRRRRGVSGSDVGVTLSLRRDVDKTFLGRTHRSTRRLPRAESHRSRRDDAAHARTMPTSVIDAMRRLLIMPPMRHVFVSTSMTMGPPPRLDRRPLAPRGRHQPRTLQPRRCCMSTESQVPYLADDPASMHEERVNRNKGT